jgi:tRNA 2-thiouridine synthesizing protein A
VSAEDGTGAGAAGAGAAGADVAVDARGLRCPVPVLRLAAAVRGLPGGTTASVLATDPAVRHDVPAWARMRGHDVVAVAVEGDVYRVVVRLGGTGTGPGRVNDTGGGTARSRGSSDR